MRGGSPRPDRVDRRFGWLLAIPVLPIGAWWVPEALAQAGSFELWWQLGGWLVAGSFLVLVAAGPRLPMRALRALWVAIPVLLILLQLVAFGALRGDEVGQPFPWVRWFDAPAICLLVLCLPAWGVVAASIASSLSMAFSAWAFSGAVSPELLADIPLRLSNVVFVALVIAMRAWLLGLHEAEAEARAAAEHRARSAAEAREQARLSRFVHDEVLSVLTAASLFRGEPPRELSTEAAAALRALSVDPRAERPRGVSATAVERLRDRLARLAPGASISVECDGAPVAAEALEALGDAAAEAARNAARHARAQRIAVRIAARGGTILVRIADDGIGFDPGALPSERLGIRESIMGRVVEAGGSARVHSAPGEGTEVELSWGPRP